MSNTRQKLLKMKSQLTPRDKYELDLKQSFQKSDKELKTFKGRTSRLRTLKNKWQPFQDMIDKYVARKVKESNNLPEKIERLEKVVKEECAHPIEHLDVIFTNDPNDDSRRTG